MNNELRHKLELKRQKTSEYLQTTALKSKRHGLDKFLISRWTNAYRLEQGALKKSSSNAMPPLTPIMAALNWLKDDFNDMEYPLLHIYGKTGTGKSHFSKGLLRWFTLNCFEFEQAVPTTIEHFDWHNFMGLLRSSFNKLPLDHPRYTPPPVINWQADVMLIEDIDRQNTTSQKGSTHSLETLLGPLKNRLEDDRLPTILISHRSVKELGLFLATDTRGTVHNAARQIAQDAANLIGNTIHRGQARGSDFRGERIKNVAYYEQVVQPALIKQNLAKILGQKDCFGLPLNW